MRTSQYLLSTLKGIPSDAEVVSHQLMLRAGMIRKLASGLYTWLPTGQRILRKVECIVREEMNKAGALEVSLPIIHPASLWKESGRWIQYGPELLRFTDHDMREFVLSPTHEEVITDLIRHEIHSYKQLPINFYQIQKKFRDEIRPCLGVIRSREFIMKDAYSFHTSHQSLQETYYAMYRTYNVIFSKMGLKFHVVQADPGSIGGSISHEFHAIMRNHEDHISYKTKSDDCMTNNIEITEKNSPYSGSFFRYQPEPKEVMQLVKTPVTYRIDELVKEFNLPIEKIVKTIVVYAKENARYPLVALMIRGDHQLNKEKAEKLHQVTVPLIFASEEEIRLNIGAGLNSLGPINFPFPLIIDRSVALMSNFVAGANVDAEYFFGINWYRDLPLPEIADLSKGILFGNINSDREGKNTIDRGIEIGHIFQLGNKYSETMKATVQHKNGNNQTLIMGCYGIGITRTIAAIVEQHHDKYGILWPEALAPFHVAILPINLHKSSRICQIAEKLYHQLSNCGIDVLLDDRHERPGVMFSDIDLIGIPHIVVIGDHTIAWKEIEYKSRTTGKKKMIHLNKIVDFLVQEIS